MFLPCYALESLVLLKVVLQIVLLDKMTGEEWVILQWNMDFHAVICVVQYFHVSRSFLGSLHAAKT